MIVNLSQANLENLKMIESERLRVLAIEEAKKLEEFEKQADIDKKELEKQTELVNAIKAELAKRSQTQETERKVADTAVEKTQKPLSVSAEEEMLRNMLWSDKQAYLEKLSTQRLKELIEYADERLRNLNKHYSTCKDVIEQQRITCSELQSEINRRELEESRAKAAKAMKNAEPKEEVQATPLETEEQKEERGLKVDLLELKNEGRELYERWESAKDALKKAEEEKKLSGIALNELREQYQKHEDKLTQNYRAQGVINDRLREVRVVQEKAEAQANADKYVVKTNELVKMRETEEAKRKHLQATEPENIHELAAQSKTVETLDEIIKIRGNDKDEAQVGQYERTEQDEKLDQLKRDMDNAIRYMDNQAKTEAITAYSREMIAYQGNDPAKQLHGSLLKDQQLDYQQRSASFKLDRNESLSVSQVRDLRADLERIGVEREQLKLKIDALVAAKEADRMAKEEGKAFVVSDVKEEVKEVTKETEKKAEVESVAEVKEEGKAEEEVKEKAEAEKLPEAKEEASEAQEQVVTSTPNVAAETEGKEKSSTDKEQQIQIKRSPGHGNDINKQMNQRAAQREQEQQQERMQEVNKAKTL